VRDRETNEWNTMTAANYMTIRLIACLQLEICIFFALDRRMCPVLAISRAILMRRDSIPHVSI
jgi:hypothetical protein